MRRRPTVPRAADAAAPTPLEALGAGSVVPLDGGKRLRLDGKVDFWPATRRWQVLGAEQEGHGVGAMLAHLVQARAQEGRPVAEPVALASDLRVVCDHCGRPAQLHLGRDVYPHRRDLADRHFWVCWPCDAWVGCRAGDERHRPLGALAKEELRDARRAAHDAFDPIWQRGLMSKAQAYEWLAHVTGLPPTRCYIGLMDADECRVVVDEATTYLHGE